MKKIGWIFLSLVAFISCTQTETVSNKIVLEGTVLNPENGYVELFWDDQQDSTSIDELGKFKFSIAADEGTYYRFKHGREHTTLYLEPGDSISLSIDPKEFDESIVYSGLGAEKNNYLAKRYLLDEQISSEMRSIWLLPLEAFSEKIDSLTQLFEMPYSEFAKLQKANASFLAIEKGKNQLFSAIAKMKYPRYHGYYAKKDDVDLPDDYYQFLNSIDVNDTVWRQVPEFESYFDLLVNQMSGELFENDPSLKEVKHARILAQFQVLGMLITDQDDLNQALFKTLSDHVKYNNIDDFDDVMAKFETLCTDADLVAKIKDELKSWETLTAGNMARNFDMVDAEGNHFQLSDFRGKYVYIDVWATWCGPCRREIPELEKMHDEYAGKNLEIISVSVDNTQEPWLEMLEKDNMKGKQMYAPNAWKSKVALAYKINSIPRFILIDRKGMIINVRAERPSGNIRQILDALPGL